MPGAQIDELFDLWAACSDNGMEPPLPATMTSTKPLTPYHWATYLGFVSLSSTMAISLMGSHPPG